MSIAIKTATLAVLTLTTAASAAAITPGNLVIYRVGDGSATLGSTGTAVFLDEYTPAGTLVQSIAQPATGTGSVVASGSATSEGQLTVTPDGKYVAFTGYNAAVGTAPLSGSASTAVNRVVGIVDVANDTTSYTFLSDASTGNNPRSAVTTTGSDIYFAGGAGGVRYATVGATTSTQLSTTVTNIRQVNVFGGQLFASDSSGTTNRLGTVGTGLPTTSGQTITNLPGFPVAGSPYGYFFADLDTGIAGPDTLYVADDAAGIQKYSLVGGNWTLNNTIGAAANAFRGLTGVVSTTASGTSVTLYATGLGTTLSALTDTSGYNAADNGTAATLATAGTNTAFRGVGFVAATPEPAGLALVGLAGLGVLRRRRASAAV